MAYGIAHFFPGGTKTQYEATMIAMNGKLGVIPEGQIFHAAGPSAGGWQIVGVHHQGKLGPLRRRGVHAADGKGHSRRLHPVPDRNPLGRNPSLHLNGTGESPCDAGFHPPIWAPASASRCSTR